MPQTKEEHREYIRRWRIAHPNYGKEQYQKHKDARKEYYESNKDTINTKKKARFQHRYATDQEYRTQMNTRCNDWRKQKLKKQRLQVINHYSNGTMKCCCCGEDTIELLNVHHINGDGKAHRKAVGSSNICNDIIKQDYPPVFEILCYNCNIGTSQYGVCPHKKDKPRL
jgi:hypothetical protein